MKYPHSQAVEKTLQPYASHKHHGRHKVQKQLHMGICKALGDNTPSYNTPFPTLLAVPISTYPPPTGVLMFTISHALCGYKRDWHVAGTSFHTLIASTLSCGYARPQTYMHDIGWRRGNYKNTAPSNVITNFKIAETCVSVIRITLQRLHCPLILNFNPMSTSQNFKILQ